MKRDGASETERSACATIPFPGLKSPNVPIVPKKEKVQSQSRPPCGLRFRRVLSAKKRFRADSHHHPRRAFTARRFFFPSSLLRAGPSGPIPTRPMKRPSRSTRGRAFRAARCRSICAARRAQAPSTWKPAPCPAGRRPPRKRHSDAKCLDTRAILSNTAPPPQT